MNFKSGALLLVMSGLTALTLSSCNSSGKKDMGEQISIESVSSIVADFDYSTVTSYSMKREYSIKVEGSQSSDGVSLSAKVETSGSQAIGMDFSDATNYYYGIKESATASSEMSMTYGEQNVASSSSSEGESGYDLQKGDDGIYSEKEVYWYTATTDGEKDGSAYEYSTALSTLDTDEAASALKLSFLSRSGAVYPAGLSTDELEDDDTKAYVNSDGVLSISGTLTSEVDSSLSVTMTANYVYQFDKTGLLVYAEYTDMKTNNSVFTLSGSMTITGEVNGTVTHTLYTDEVKNSIPSDISVNS